MQKKPENILYIAKKSKTIRIAKHTKKIKKGIKNKKNKKFYAMQKKTLRDHFRKQKGQITNSTKY